MYIKKITIKNFQSYYDEHVIELSNGVKYFMVVMILENQNYLMYLIGVFLIEYMEGIKMVLKTGIII